jgi:hypothetical protein
VPSHYHRNLFAISAACFIGFAGFTLVMPFLPLYFEQLGVHDVGEIAFWSAPSSAACSHKRLACGARSSSRRCSM